ncbi:hypothetical protein J7384_17240 [Endozoicomonas sp. G2_1]|uniref:hypothetical protein n=1 Tax=Endozoicomonas sp. G2_1 TaxID=2821091 RepID=UPI001ADD3640|nr:hypothetical protein [Endozoicomonas sp. G2_1]MBO9492110.1 hypothetical protein [Endozoicomonas sp. G2_1]
MSADLPLKLFKRMLYAYLSALAFNLTMQFISLDYYMWGGVIYLLVGLWCVEQVFKINKAKGSKPSNWREYYEIIAEFTTHENRR